VGHNQGKSRTLGENMVSVLTRSKSTKRRTKSPQQKTLRPDIQGLRAVAVLAVVFDHLLGWPHGGFVGVDVFFVISGFLITGHLIRTRQKTGRISYSDFYKKRFKRLMPSAVLVLAATVGTAFLVFNRTRAEETAVDGLWALFFAGNWRQVTIGTDYFESSGPVSPLQHYWSLAVEEQFYFAWPLLISAAFLLAGRFAKTSKAALGIAGLVMLGITAASFLWALLQTEQATVVAYFSTFTRVWELGVGALLAMAVGTVSRLPQTVRPFLAWAGLVGIVVSIFITDAAAGFPAPAAALPVLATALVIAAGTGATSHRGLGVITNRAATYIGDVSYSVYLWHFPIIIFAGYLMPDTSLITLAITAAAIAAFSIYGYHLVEDPIRKSSWLTGASTARHHHRAPVSSRYKNIALSALFVGVAAVVASSFTLTSIRPSELSAIEAYNAKVSTSQLATEAPEESAVAYGPEVAALQSELTQALLKTEWPELSPSIDDVMQNNPEPEGVNQCGNQEPGASCIWGDENAPNTAILVGDSVGIAWMPALIELYGQGEWNLRMEAKYGCPFTGRGAEYDAAECFEKKELAIERIKADEPDLVIVANNYPDDADIGVWSSELASIIQRTGASDRTMVLAPPPHSGDPRACYRPGSIPLDCTTTLTDWYPRITGAEQSAAENIDAVYVSTASLFCKDSEECPVFAGKTPLKVDDTHPTSYYVEKIAPALGELIASAQAEATNPAPGG
jgi:peptidoglycan/LPS O-acetylase OafA/YrhL